ncbi:Druantia anti-phage system protein DruA [Bacillus halotolerans]|uniref:Druantia anti-phage system protein DruA n=1 Tax=Bacillus halotolerans TaxID=260554 RepID=UPI002DBE9751|nr:Druantia anti-phage system protein DruA [Bacillus halotolerans]MEC1604964.1 DUF4338 domain-containing protein [Bacillus halotolerans]
MNTNKIRKIDYNYAEDEFKDFSPRLSEYHQQIFSSIINKLLSKYPGASRSEFINQEIDRYNEMLVDVEKDIELLKLISALSVLRDLLIQGWRIRKNADDILMLAPPPLDDNENKIFIRKRLQKERNTQLRTPSVSKFIKKMEKTKTYKEKELNITHLIGDKNILIKGIEDLKGCNKMLEREEKSKDIIKPYIQLVTNDRCEHTGYRLRDIWRYFRYTWSIPYKSTPGRNQFYIVRDSAQPYHPIIGIFALGNSVLHLTKRDNYIGWTLEAIKEKLKKRVKNIEYEEMKSGNTGAKNKVQYAKSLETEEEFITRVNKESTEILGLLTSFIENAIGEISIEGLINQSEQENPTEEVIEKLNDITVKLQKMQFNNKRSTGEVNWKKESNTPLFMKKRAQELARLLEAKMVFLDVKGSCNSDMEVLQNLVKYKGGKYINIALQANRKMKIGSNMMEIIVCGAIPPYNEILGGKLVSMLACSPLVVKQYNDNYSHQVSEIASRMKGEKVVRDSRLAFLGTTSLYQSGSSQYNRIKIPANSGKMKYKKLGETEGFGSVFFTSQTSSFISEMLEELEGGRRINNVFGEGTSPRMRLIRHGLATLGIPEEFTKHHTKRIVFGIELASNSLEFLQGKTNQLDYYMPLEDASSNTEEIINFWRKRWLLKRIETVDIITRLSKFEKGSLKVSAFN